MFKLPHRRSKQRGKDLYPADTTHENRAGIKRFFRNSRYEYALNLPAAIKHQAGYSPLLSIRRGF